MAARKDLLAVLENRLGWLENQITAVVCASFGIPRANTPNLASSAAVCGQGLSRSLPRIRSSKLDFEAILNPSSSPKVVISVPDSGVVKPLYLINISPKRLPLPLQVAPLVPKYVRRVIGLTGAYMLTGAGCKKACC